MVKQRRQRRREQKKSGRSSSDETDAELIHVERLRTSVAGLDAIVGGGLLAGRLYLIEGRPGSGKTVLAAQLCFERARRGDTCVFVTTLSESHSTLLSNLASFDFFEPRFVDERICFISGYHIVEQGGLDALVRMVTATVRKTKARLLVIDTLTCPGEGGAARSKRFMRDIAALCSLLGCTAVCVAPPSERAGERRIEQASDGILELSRSTIGLRSARMIEVLKLRGSASLDGKHTFTISSRGVTVYPRIEALMTTATPVAQESRVRVSIGLPALDRMFGGGITSASSTAIAGAPGTGKTLLGLHFLAEGARVGEPGLYFGFYETPSRLIA
jgi:circadian clock protein KaiC